MKLCEFELDVLRMLSGRGPDMQWGAAVGACLGFLKGSGYVAAEHGSTGITYKITERGLAVLDAQEHLAP